jgi:hypothetical protein
MDINRIGAPPPLPPLPLHMGAANTVSADTVAQAMMAEDTDGALAKAVGANGFENV